MEIEIATAIALICFVMALVADTSKQFAGAAAILYLSSLFAGIVRAGLYLDAGETPTALVGLVGCIVCAHMAVNAGFRAFRQPAKPW